MFIKKKVGYEKVISHIYNKEKKRKVKVFFSPLFLKKKDHGFQH